MTTQREDLLRSLKIAASCPIDWVSETNSPEIDRLLIDWLHAIRDTAVSPEITWLALKILLGLTIDETDSEISLATKDLLLRKNQATNSYLTKTGRWSNLKFLAPSYNGKHYRVYKDPDDLLTWTKHGPSLFKSNLKPEALKKLFWMWFDQTFAAPPNISYVEWLQDGTFENPACEKLWSSLQLQHQARISFDTIHDVGAVNGAWSHFVAMDLDFASRTCHAYPVSQQEANQIMDPTTLCRLQIQN